MSAGTITASSNNGGDLFANILFEGHTPPIYTLEVVTVVSKQVLRLTIEASGSNTWLGTTSTDWSDPNNWSSGVPSGGEDVIIEKTGAEDTVIPGDLTLGQITVKAGNTFSLPASTTITATSIINEGIVVFNDTSKLIGDITNEEGATLTFTVNKPSEITGEIINKSDLTLTSRSAITIGKLTNTKNIIIDIKSKVTIEAISDIAIVNNIPGIITIKSNSNGTGSLFTKGSVSGTGSFRSQRWIDNSDNTFTSKDDNDNLWQLVSSNVVGETSNAFNGHYLNWYDEDPGEFNAYKSTSEELNIGQGYVSRFGTVDGTNPIILEGKFYTGAKTINLDSGVGEETYSLPEGFNLIGNPYPSSLKWDKVYLKDNNKDIVTRNMYYYENTPTSHSWKTADATAVADEGNIIPSGQGFGVILINNIAGSIKIPNSARTTNLGAGFNKRSQNLSTTFTLVASNKGIVDEIVFKENNLATTNYDHQYDAFKLNSFSVSPTPSFVSADDKKLAICETPQVESIDLAFNMNADGEIVFSLSNIVDFNEILLEDKTLNIFTDLIQGDYTFQYSTSDTEFGRFTLHFSKDTLSEEEKNIGLNIYSFSKTLYISSSEVLKDVSIKLYDMSGQQVFNKKYSSLNNKEINTNLNYGIYILEVTTNKRTTTQKISLTN